MASKNIKLAQNNPEDDGDIEDNPEFEDRLQERMDEQAPDDTPAPQGNAEEPGPGDDKVKPPFDPNAPHTVLKSSKPPFDPSKPASDIAKPMAPGQTAVPAHAPYSGGESFVEGLKQGYMPFMDELAGGQNALIDKAQSLFPGQKPVDFATQYRYWRDKARQRSAGAEQDNPGLYRAGMFPGAVTSPLNEIGRPVEKNHWSNIVGEHGPEIFNLGKSGIVGGVYGVGNSTADLTKGDPEEYSKMLEDLESGGLTNMGMHAAVSGLGGASGAVSAQNLENKANAQAVRAGGATKAQLKDLMRSGKLQQTGNAMLTPAEAGGENAVQFGSKVEDILPRVQAQKADIGDKMDVVSRAIDDATPKAVSGPDIAKNIRDYASRYPRTPGMSSILDDLENEAKYYEGKGNMSFEDAQAHKNTYKYNRNAEPSKIAADNAKKMAVGGEMENAADKFTADPNIDQGTKDKVALYRDLKSRYGAMETMENAGLDKSAANLKNRGHSLTDHMMGLGVLAPSIGAAAAGHTGALAGIPAALATAMANKALRTRGSSMAAVTHQILSKDPEYMQTVGQQDQGQ